MIIQDKKGTFKYIRVQYLCLLELLIDSLKSTGLKIIIIVVWRWSTIIERNLSLLLTNQKDINKGVMP